MYSPCSDQGVSWCRSVAECECLYTDLRPQWTGQAPPLQALGQGQSSPAATVSAIRVSQRKQLFFFFFIEFTKRKRAQNVEILNSILTLATGCHPSAVWNFWIL